MVFASVDPYFLAEPRRGHVRGNGVGSGALVLEIGSGLGSVTVPTVMKGVAVFRPLVVVVSVTVSVVAGLIHGIGTPLTATAVLVAVGRVMSVVAVVNGARIRFAIAMIVVIPAAWRSSDT